VDRTRSPLRDDTAGQERDEEDDREEVLRHETDHRHEESWKKETRGKEDREAHELANMRQVHEDSGYVRRVAFLLWVFAFLVCVAFLGFIGFGYLRDVFDGLPKLP
jgi:hypothetical protein